MELGVPTSTLEVHMIHFKPCMPFQNMSSMSNECLSKVSIYERWILDYIRTVTTKFAIMDTNISNMLKNC